MANPYTLTGGEFYVDPASQAAQFAASEKAAGHLTRDRWVIEQHIAKVPQFKWVGYGALEGQLSGYLAGCRQLNQLAQISVYGIPNRDNGGESGGGAPGLKEYIKWINQLGLLIHTTPSIVLLETDSIMHLPSLPSAGREERIACLNYAVHYLKETAVNTFVYLDGGDGRWNRPEQLAPWLVKAGIAGARGFAVNVANYNTTSVCDTFARDLNVQLGEWGVGPKRVIIDTSRNGNGPDTAGTWCNAAGRKLGAHPSALGAGSVDALVWGKRPGESDGNCGSGVGTESGEFVPRLAVNLYDGK